MQSAFHLLRPTLNLSKAVHMLDRAWDDEFMDGFLALETWGNDNVSFPGAATALHRGALSRRRARARDASRSRAARAAGGHHLPHAGGHLRARQHRPGRERRGPAGAISSRDKHRIHLPGGHVGAVVSKKAAQGLWPAIAQFWADRDALSTLRCSIIILASLTR
jgi:polyhydroxyalkanoate synthase